MRDNDAALPEATSTAATQAWRSGRSVDHCLHRGRHPLKRPTSAGGEPSVCGTPAAHAAAAGSEARMRAKTSSERCSSTAAIIRAGPTETRSPRSTLHALSHVCYICGMTEVASRELRNDTRGLLRRVAGGEDIVITVDGEPVAALRPLRRRPRWMQGTEFVQRLTGRQADPGLAAELRALAPDMTDELER